MLQRFTLNIFTFSFIISTVSYIYASDTIYIAVNGNDLGTGKFSSPYKTITKGINTAVPGDIIFLKKGIYRERVTITKSGESEKPIVVTGEKDVIVDGGTLLNGWEKVSTYGGNIYRLPYNGAKPYNLTWNNKYILRIRDEFQVFPGMDTTLRYGPKGWDTYEGLSYRSWDGVQAMWGTYQNYIYIGFGDKTVNPDSCEITYAPSTGNGGAVITLNGCSFINIAGLTIRNGYNGIYLRNNCSNCIIENDSVVGGKYCINITSGSKNIKVRKNKLTLGYVNPLDPDNPRHWFIWAAFKKTSDYDRICVSLDNVGADNEISENYMFENFDGVENTGTSLRLTVRDNLIERMADDGLEPCGEETEARWHGNIVKQCNIAYRHKEITGNGPMYIYMNKFYSKPGNSYGGNSGIYLFSGETTTAFFYHNTIVTTLGFSFGSTNVNTGLPNLWIINNLFSCTKIYNENTSWTKKPHFDYNYIGGDITYKPTWWGDNNKIIKDGRLWSQDSVPDFLISAYSPARDVGIDISKTWSVQGISNAPLAGYPSGYFLGTRPDAGAHIYGKILDSNRGQLIPERQIQISCTNPFHDKVILHFNSIMSGNLNIQLFNIYGSKVYQDLIYPGSSSTATINFNEKSLENGIYILRLIQTDKVLGVIKLLKCEDSVQTD